jgi:tol-pal system beta propeller repeat protein TolB
VTPPPLGSFTMLYSDIEQGAALPSLYRGQADGTGEIKLESGTATGGYTDVAYDPTGQRIAFVRSVTPSGDTNGDGTPEVGEPIPQLFVASLASPEDAHAITNFTSSTLGHPSWSPDGQRIVFSTNTDGDEEIAVINADGSGFTALTNNSARDFDPSFSPDGTQIVFASDLNSPGYAKIFSMMADGSQITQLTEVANSYSPAWSPDGSRIAYVNDQQGDGDIYVMDADGQRSTLLTVDDNGAEDRSPAWTPDGRWIVFASNRADDQFRWYAVDLNGTVQPVTLEGRNPQSISFLTTNS